MKRETMWKCSIGMMGEHSLPPGADGPMREAIARAFREITGKEPQFLFSGWGEELSEGERRVLDEIGFGIDRAHFAGFDRGGTS